MIESNKPPEMEAMLNQLFAPLFGRTRQEAFEAFICIDCGRDCKDLAEADIKEYRLSALCPECFDKACPEE